jgi:hypothetical protein
MKSRTAVLLVGGALALGLGACGGGGGSDEGSADSSSTPATTQEKAKEAPTTSKGGLTPPGTKLKFGEAATLVWVPPSLHLEGKSEGPKLKVTVDSIEKGSIGDFDEVEDLESDEQNSTPYYMHIAIEALEDVSASIEDDADLGVTAIDDRGQEQESITFFGEFSACNDEEMPTGMKAGESFESCMAYLIPGGGSIVEAKWDNGPDEANGEVTPYFEEPVVWGP